MYVRMSYVDVCTYSSVRVYACCKEWAGGEGKGIAGLSHHCF